MSLKKWIFQHFYTILTLKNVIFTSKWIILTATMAFHWSISIATSFSPLLTLFHLFSHRFSPLTDLHMCVRSTWTSSTACNTTFCRSTRPLKICPCGNSTVRTLDPRAVFTTVVHVCVHVCVQIWACRLRSALCRRSSRWNCCARLRRTFRCLRKAWRGTPGGRVAVAERAFGRFCAVWKSTARLRRKWPRWKTTWCRATTIWSLTASACTVCGGRRWRDKWLRLFGRGFRRKQRAVSCWFLAFFVRKFCRQKIIGFFLVLCLVKSILKIWMCLSCLMFCVPKYKKSVL